jgi:hypothetical protein
MRVHASGSLGVGPFIVVNALKTGGSKVRPLESEAGDYSPKQKSPFKAISKINGS